jgi:hypothetical protein
VGDLLLDSVTAILQAEVTPPFPVITVGKPATLDTDRSAFIWYAGDVGDQSVEQYVGQSAIRERIQISVLWARATGAAPDLLAEHEYEARAAVRQIKRAMHLHAGLAGYPGQGTISDSFCGASVAGIWKDDGGAEFDMVTVTWEALLLEGDLKEV